MTRWFIGIIIASLVVAFGVAAGLSTDGVDDTDVVMSDMPLSGLKAMNEGEHQANDFGPVMIIIVETCNGTPT